MTPASYTSINPQSRAFRNHVHVPCCVREPLNQAIYAASQLPIRFSHVTRVPDERHGSRP